MNKAYAIFDMDGTLVDSMSVWNNLGREYLLSKGITEELEPILEQIAPMTMSQSAALFVRQFSLPLSPREVAEEMNAMMEKHYRQDIPLKTGVLSLLAQLKHRGVRMCVASTTAKELMEACLKRLDILPFFDFLLSCEEINTSKQNPDIYLAAAAKFGAVPQDIAVYEDALYAIQTARAAGFYVVGVYEQLEDSQWSQIRKISHETIVLY